MYIIENAIVKAGTGISLLDVNTLNKTLSNHKTKTENVYCFLPWEIKLITLSNLKYANKSFVCTKIQVKAGWINVIAKINSSIKKQIIILIIFSPQLKTNGINNTIAIPKANNTPAI